MNGTTRDDGKTWSKKRLLNFSKYCTGLAIAGTMLAIAIPTFAASGAATVNTSGDARRPSKLILPSATLARTGEVPVVYRLSQGFTGHASLHVLWTDSLGRTVEDKTVPADLLDETEITFPIDMSLAVAMKNHLHVDLTLNGKDIKDAAYDRSESAEADFVAQPPFTGWKDYVIMMWQNYPANLIPDLQKLGINGATYSSRNVALPDFLIDNNMRWYSESLATDYYSEYHRWRPDRTVGWSFIQAKKLYQEDPNSLAAFKRHPSFWDPYWRKKVHDRGVATAERLAPYRPYFYSLADESGIAELEAAWDFDFSDESLVPMRRWLQAQYGSLGALNQEWGTNFTNWNLVMPLTTNQAMKRTDDNYAAWADFKEWMDISYADALKMGVDAIHEADPHAYVNIGGGQMPGWGGYDYSRIAKVLNAIEPYDIGRSVDIVHSLNPKMAIMSTSFAAGDRERQRVWYELLHGNRGLIIWDEGEKYVQKDGQPSAVGKQAGELYSAIRNGEGALIVNSHPVNNTIALHYSQPSLRTQWMLERRPDGDAWMTRSPSYERSTNDFMRLRESWCNLIEDEGLQPNFVSYDQVAQGDLLKHGYHVLVLPESSSLSKPEANAIREFVAQGGVAIADGIPGTYDEHSRKLPDSSLADLFAGPNAEQVNAHAYGKGKAILLNVDIVSYLQNRLNGKEGPVHQLVEQLLRSNDVRPGFSVEDTAGHSVVGIDAHVYANGGVRIIALQSNPQLRVNELGPADFRSNERFTKPTPVHLHLPHPMYLYDTMARKELGQKKDLTLTVDPYDPTILVASDTPLPQMQVSVPERVQRGSVANIAIHAGPSPADLSIFHVEVRDPEGNLQRFYSGNVIARQGAGVKSIPFAANDAPGKWTVDVRDVMSGQSVQQTMDLQ
ncbi:MAG: beta-galactosidase [Acidobacteriaceae bacterium]